MVGSIILPRQSFGLFALRALWTLALHTFHVRAWFVLGLPKISRQSGCCRFLFLPVLLCFNVHAQ